MIIIGLAALGVGGELLVRAAVTLGLRAGLSSLVTGLTIVAMGTSAPELAVCIDAALIGSPGIAIGNIVGSNFTNIALVLGISALLLPVAIESFLLRRDLPVMLLGFAVITGALMPDGIISRSEGLIFLVILLAYLVHVIRVSRRRHGRSEEEVEEHTAEVIIHGSMMKVMVMLLGGLILLSAGGHWLVQGGIALAVRLGISEALIGMTVIAVGTSLPEVTASVISILRKHAAMALGGIVGSNIWNTFGVLGTTAFLTPLPREQVNLTMLGVMVLAGVVLWVFCVTSREVNRWEGGALLAGFCACQYLLFH